MNTIDLGDPRQRVSRVGETGMLFLAGSGIFPGYWARADLSRGALRPWNGTRAYCTGDLVKVLSSGELEFVGRLDSQVKIRGQRMELGEVEAAFRHNPRVLQVVAVKRANPAAGEEMQTEPYLAVYLSLTPGPALSVGELLAEAAAHLQVYMRPSRLVVMDALPQNRSGKIERKLLPLPPPRALEHVQQEPSTADSNGDGAVSVPSDQPQPHELGSGNSSVSVVLQRLAKAWSAVLGVPLRLVRPDSNFFSLGGSSLVLAKLYAAFEPHWKKSVSLVQLFGLADLQATAAAIAANLIPPQPQTIQLADSHSHATG